MVGIPFPLSTAPGRRLHESAGRLINCYAEPMGQGAAYPAKYVRVPGLTSFGTSAQTGPRGQILVGSDLYTAFSGKLYKSSSSGGALALVGNLSGTLPVYFARNNAATPDKVVVTENGAFTFTTTTVAGSYPDADLPQPNSVTSIDGYLVFSIGDGRAFATDLNSTAVNALSFGKAEFKPDALLRAVAVGGVLLFCGTETIEVWQDVGASPFPFTRSGIVKGPGLVATSAISGFEEGFTGSVLYVGSDYGVHKLSGYLTEKISPPDLDGLIEALSDKTTLEMCSYVSRGRAITTITCAAWSWEYNHNTGKWNERESYLLTRWRGKNACKAFNYWIVADSTSGNIYRIDATSEMEGTNPLIYRIESAPVSKFPAQQIVPRADFDFVTGVGVATGDQPQQTEPTARIWWCDDGLNWNGPRIVQLGKQAKTVRVLVTLTGMAGAQGRRWKIEMPDPVYASLLGGEMQSRLVA
jgi:hypothetical protein